MRAPSLRAVSALLALGALAGCTETGGSGAPQPTNDAGSSSGASDAGTSGASAAGDAPVGVAGFVSAGGGGAGGVGGAAGVAGSSVSFARPDFPNYALTGSWPNRPVALAAKPGQLSFTRVTLHSRFLAESCAIGDYDGDGNPVGAGIAGHSRAKGAV